MKVPFATSVVDTHLTIKLSNILYINIFPFNPELALENMLTSQHKH